MKHSVLHVLKKYLADLLLDGAVYAKKTFILPYFVENTLGDNLFCNVIVTADNTYVWIDDLMVAARIANFNNVLNTTENVTVEITSRCKLFENPRKIETMGKYVFYDCKSLQEVVLPTQIKEIGEYAFYGCKALKNVSMGEGVTSIGKAAFYGCSSLQGQTHVCEEIVREDEGIIDCHCDPFLLLKEDQNADVTSNQGRLFTQATAESFDEVGTSFMSLLQSVGSYVGKKELESTSKQYNIYNAFFRDIKLLYNQADLSAARDIDFKITESVFVGLDSDLLVMTKREKWEDAAVYTRASVLSVLSGIWGFDTANESGEFLSIVDAIKQKYVAGENGAGLSSPQARIKYNGAVYTESGYFFLPFVVESSNVDPVLVCFFINNEKAYCWISQAKELSEAITSNEIHIYGRCRLFEVPRLILPSALTTISNSAFYGCTTLERLTLSDGLESIGDSAFYGCVKIREIALPATITGLGAGAFRGCTALRTIGEAETLETIQITAIPDYLFYGCESLVEATVPATVQSIGLSAFYNCQNLTSVKLTQGENGISSIGNSAFYNCKKLSDFALPNSVVTIGATAFGGCESLTEVDLGEKLTSIGSWAFENCTGLTSIVFDADSFVTKIEWGLFNGCVHLKTVTLTDKITEIDSVAFENCLSLTSISLPAIARINAGTFRGCAALERVSLSEGLQSIDEGAFNWCEKLKYFGGDLAVEGELLLPSNVVSIGEKAFFGCTAMTKIVVPDTVTAIGAGAFGGCSAVEDITLPFVGNRAGVGISDKNQYPFGYVFGSTAYVGGIRTAQNYYGVTFSSATIDYYYVPATLKTITITGGNILYGAFMNCLEVTEIVLPQTITSLGGYAFAYCRKIASVDIPVTVKSLGDGVFYSCDLLDEICIPATVTSVGKNVLFGCPIQTASVPDIVVPSLPKARLVDVTISSGTTVLDEAFSGCDNLESISLPDSLMNLGNNVFDGCDNLNFYTYGNGYYLGNENSHYIVFYKAVAKDLTSITVQANTKFVYDEAFSENGLLEKIVLPSQVRHIGAYAFSGVRAAVIWTGNVIEKLGPYSFAGYLGTEIAIPGSVKTVDKKCGLDSCSQITKASVPVSVLPLLPKAVVQELEIIGSDAVGRGVLNGFSSLVKLSVPFIGESPTTDELSKNQYPFGCFFGTTSYAGAVATEQYYYADPAAACVSERYYIPDSLKCVTLREGVCMTYGVFYGCSHLENVLLPAGLVTVAEKAFYNCAQLTSLDVPETVTNIGAGALSGCGSLERLSLPFIGNRAVTAEDAYQYPLGFIFGTEEYEGGEITEQFFYKSSLEEADSEKYCIPTSLTEVTTGGEFENHRLPIRSDCDREERLL